MTGTTKSMTGFGRAGGSSDGATWTWELRSVNARGLDVRLRLANGAERLEPEIRKRLTAALSRGSVSVQLEIKADKSAPALKINRDVLEMFVAEAESLRDRIGAAPVQAESLLALRGVIDAAEPDDGADPVADAKDAILADLDAAISALVVARGEEGARLRAIVSERIDDIAALTAAAATHPSRTPEAIRARLAGQIARILENEAMRLDPDRLHQEAAILATKADIEEEVKRLESHVASARELLQRDEPVGRRLDFLTQEFNREANTLCAKANDPGITEIGLQLKTLIDQVREQVQNIE